MPRRETCSLRQRSIRAADRLDAKLAEGGQQVLVERRAVGALVALDQSRSSRPRVYHCSATPANVMPVRV